MSPALITSNLDSVLPCIVIAANPRSCRALVARAGRPYALRFDEIMEAMNESKALNHDVGLRELVVKHGGRIVTLWYAKVRADQYEMPKLRMVATSIECEASEKPDSVLETFLRALKAAVTERGKTADATLAELIGAGYKWDAAA